MTKRYLTCPLARRTCSVVVVVGESGQKMNWNWVGAESRIVIRRGGVGRGGAGQATPPPSAGSGICPPHLPTPPPRTIASLTWSMGMTSTSQVMLCFAAKSAG